MIIHVAGPSGSGKSYIAKSLKKLKLKNTIIIDTDIHDDKVSLEIKNLTLAKRVKLNKQYLKNLIKNNSEKNIIIVGISFFGDADPVNICDVGFFIDIDMKALYKQYISRTINSICLNKNALLKLVEYPEKGRKIAGHKYFIRNELNFDYDEFTKNMNNFTKNYLKKHKYKILTTNKIINYIAKLLTT